MESPAILALYAATIETELARCFDGLSRAPSALCAAMRYGALGGGKRIRGALVMGSCAAVGGREQDALPAACALEMVHAFSLIHDDLPCMDDDDLRRGKPTCHKVYGEAIALLAGDALLAEGVRTLAESGAPQALEAVLILLVALGPTGTIGGQVLDMQAELTRPDFDSLRAMHAAKTGALIRASVRIGALLGGATEGDLAALDAYASSFGLAFQIVDDLLDVVGDARELGKTPGSDLRNDKATYPGLLGLEQARETAKAEIARAVGNLAPFGERGVFLAELAGYACARAIHPALPKSGMV